jgi:L-ascorbate metabolism protein UlaG (beta-lactamase superfamily)
MNIGIGGSLTWLGHAAFRFTADDGTVTLMDPWLSGNPACPEDLKSVKRCDQILLTHAHGDHIGDTIEIATQTGAKVVAIVEIAEWLSDKGVSQVIGMNKGGSVTLGSLRVSMVHAVHSSSIADGGRRLYGGEAAGFVFRADGGAPVYHAGDTDVFGDMRIIGQIHAPKLALLPIGGHYTMGPTEAAVAIAMLGVTDVVPMHYGTFPALAGNVHALEKLLSADSEVRIHSIRPGDTIR